MDEHKYRVDAPEGHDVNLKVPAAGYEDSQEYECYNVLGFKEVTRTLHTGLAVGIFLDNKPEETRIVLG